MDATERARRSDALFYDGITSRRILCDMIARLENELAIEKKLNDENATITLNPGAFNGMYECVGFIDSYGNGSYRVGLKPDQQITRCRDCKNYDVIIHACRLFDHVKKDHVSYVFDDGFCAWGKRRDPLPDEDIEF